MWLDLLRLEIARGHDGLLQGKPEPVVALGLYVVEPGATRLVVRALWRFHPAHRLPAAVGAIEPTLVDGGKLPKAARGWVVVAAALEEDGGGDLGRLFAALERPAGLHFVTEDGGAEHGVDDVLARPSPTVPRPVHLLIDGVDAGATCASDDWVGAAVVGYSARGPSRGDLRLHFSAGSRRNDWTAVLDVGT